MWQNHGRESTVNYAVLLSLLPSWTSQGANLATKLFSNDLPTGGFSWVMLKLDFSFFAFTQILAHIAQEVLTQFIPCYIYIYIHIYIYSLSIYIYMPDTKQQDICNFVIENKRPEYLQGVHQYNMNIFSIMVLYCWYFTIRFPPRSREG